MLGMNGFRVFNSPTFPLHDLHLITHAMPGSDFLVVVWGNRRSSCGSEVSPVIGVAQIEHRKRVLLVSMLMGTLMRVQIAAIALSAWFLQGPVLVFAVMFFLGLLGLFWAARRAWRSSCCCFGKVILIRLRGRLQALRNPGRRPGLGGDGLFGGALPGLGASSSATATPRPSRSRPFSPPSALSLLAMHDARAGAADPASRRAPVDRMREFPALLAADRGYMFFMIAQTCATAGRIGVPFYILFARHIRLLTGCAEGGKNIGLLSLEAARGR